MPELLGDGGEAGVVVVQPLQRRLDPVGRLGRRGPGALQGEPGLLGAAGGLGQLRAGLVDRRLHLQQRRLRRRAAARGGRPEHVALGGDRHEVGTGADDRARLAEARHHDVARQQPVHRRTQRVGGGDQVGGGARPGGQPGQVGPGAGRGRATEEQARASRVVVLEPAQRVDGGVDRLDGDGVGGTAQRGGDGGLVARLDVQQRGDRPEDAAQPAAGGEQRAGAVGAGQAHLQRLLAGAPGGAVAVGGALGLGEPVDLGGGGERGLLGGGVLGVQALLALLDAGDLLLERGELLLREPAAVGGLGERALQPADLGLAGLDPAAARGDLPGEPGQALPPVGGGAQQRGHVPLGLAVRVLGLAALGDPLLQHLAGLLDLGGQLLLLGPGPLGLRPQVVGVAAGVGGLDRVLRAQQPHPLGGQGAGAAQPLAQPGQPVPGLRGLGEPRRGLGGLALQGAERLAAGGDRLLDLGPARAQRGLVGDLLLERGGQLDQLVGEQAGAGVAHVGLDGHGAAGDLGLLAERAELAPDLGGEVADAGEVGLHRVELAERLLLALAVLEDAGGLLDEAAPVLGRRVQHLVELALPDDDVHLPADAGVRQQLLDVEQPGGGAVDRVLRAAGAEHRPRDRDLGVLDRQRAVGVVDGQRHLGPAQRGAAGGAGEDDVLHLAAAQALGALLAHHPGQGVHDVGLARAVRADDAGDAGLEPQGGGRREGLEALQREGLEVQALAPAQAGVGRTRSP